MAALFPLEVHTPYRLFYSGPVESIVLTLSDGEAAVYANHSPFTAPVVPCLLRIRDRDGNRKIAVIAEGMLEVKEHKTVLMSDAAEWPEEIDFNRANAAKERAEEILRSGGMKFEMQKAAYSLLRAKMRISAREEGEQNP